MKRQQQHLDTQVVSYAMKGRWDRTLEGSCISSIVANELLLAQSQNHSQANLYIPLLSTHHRAGLPAIDLRRRDHPFGKRLSGSIIMDFGNEFPSIVEYNNPSIDSELSRFAAELPGASPSPAGGFIEIPFLRTDAQKRRSSHEPKEYINAGWRVQFSRIQHSGPDWQVQHIAEPEPRLSAESGELTSLSVFTVRGSTGRALRLSPGTEP